MISFDAPFFPNRIVFERGGTKRAGALAGELGARRAFIVCGRTVAGNGMLDTVKTALGSRFAGAFPQIESQNPLACVQRGAAAAEQAGADLLVSIGGGSAMDGTKVIALMLKTGGDYKPYLVGANAADRKKLDGPVLPHIAIPTTTGSGSEVMPSCGCRDPEVSHKLLFLDRALVPSIALLDPEMTVATGAWLTATSTMTAAARCIETLYSRRRNPYSTAIALRGLKLINENLPRTLLAPDDIEARANCQIAASLASMAGAAGGGSVVHCIGHITGPRYGLQHGETHAILLPPAMRLLLPEIGEPQHEVLQALGGKIDGISADEAGRAAAAKVAALLAGLPLKQRLRDLGIPKADLPDLARQAMQQYMMPQAPRTLTQPDVMALLEEVW